MRIKEQETRLTLHEHDDGGGGDDDDDDNDESSRDTESYIMTGKRVQHPFDRRRLNGSQNTSWALRQR